MDSADAASRLPGRPIVAASVKRSSISASPTEAEQRPSRQRDGVLQQSMAGSIEPNWSSDASMLQVDCNVAVTMIGGTGTTHERREDRRVPRQVWRGRSARHPGERGPPAAVVVLRPMSLDEFISLQHHESKRQRSANIGDPRIITAPFFGMRRARSRGRRKPNSPTRRGLSRT